MVVVCSDQDCKGHEYGVLDYKLHPNYEYLFDFDIAVGTLKEKIQDQTKLSLKPYSLQGLDISNLNCLNSPMK